MATTTTIAIKSKQPNQSNKEEGSKKLRTLPKTVGKEENWSEKKTSAPSRVTKEKQETGKNIQKYESKTINPPR